MTTMTRLEQANLMVSARTWHRHQGTVTNVMLALQFGLASNRLEAEKLCLSLGLYPWGKRYDTKLKTITDHINKEK